MKNHMGNWIGVLALTGLLGACGGGKEDSTQPAAASEYAGQVADEKGMPLSGISVRLENRTTDELTEAVSTTDGSFIAKVEPGVYDIIFDDPNAAKYVSVQKTAVDLQTAKKAQVQLPTALPLTENLLTGTVTHLDGSPAANQKLLITPEAVSTHDADGQLNKNESFSLFITTNSRGLFQINLEKEYKNINFNIYHLDSKASQAEMDKVSYRASYPTLESRDLHFENVKNFILKHGKEIFDVKKPDGAMHMDLKIGSPVRNIRNASGTFNGIPEDDIKLLEYITDVENQNDEQNSNQPIAPALPPAANNGLTKNLFQFSLTKNPVKNEYIGKLTGGELEISQTCELKNFKNIIAPTSDPLANDIIGHMKICVEKYTFPFGGSVHVVKLSTNRPGKYSYTDQFNNVKNLQVFTNVITNIASINHTSHYLKYKPLIHTIEFVVPMDSEI